MNSFEIDPPDDGLGTGRNLPGAHRGRSREAAHFEIEEANNMTGNEHIRLCEHCIAAIRSRGEKVFKLESLEYSELYEDHDEDEQGYLTCEWCEEELPKDSLFDCVFP